MQQRRQPAPNVLDDAWRWALAAVPPAVALLIWTPSLNDIEPVKFLLTIAVAATCLAAVLVGAGRHGRLSLPTGPFPLALGAAVLVLAIAAMRSGHLQMGLFGTRARLDGILLYAAAGICAMGAAQALGPDPGWRRRYVIVLTRGGAVLGAIALLQAAGFVPFGMRSEVSGAFATLGNPNFLAGWAGAVAGAPLALLLWERRITAQATWGLALLLLLGGAAASGSTQWVGSAGASCGTVVLVWVLSRTAGRLRALLLAGIALGAAVGVAALGAGLVGNGPLAGISGDIGTRLRGHYWQAALGMTADNPVFGVGPGRFIWTYRDARSPAAAADVAVTSVADSAHNVWLNFMAVGGLPLLIAFLAVLGLSALAIRRLLAQTPATSTDRAAVAALAAVEAGYLLQSIVSIEVPSLVVLHLFTAGVLAGAAGTVRWREVELPALGGAPVRTAVAGAGAVIVLIGAGAVGSRPVSAETAAQRGVSGQGATAVMALRAATERAPWEPHYQEQLASELLEGQELDGALDVFARADDLADPDAAARISAAIAAAAAGDRVEEARELFTASLEAEPRHPDLKLRFARFEAEAGEVDAAVAILDDLLAQFPDHAEAIALREELGQGTGP